MAKTRRTRMSAENDHRRVTRARLRMTVKETQGYPTGYLRASSDTIQRGPESREVGYETSIILGGCWVYQNPDGGVARPADMALVRETGQKDGPESNGPAQRVVPRCRSRPSKGNPVFGFVVHGTGASAGPHCPRRVRQRRCHVRRTQTQDNSRLGANGT